MSDRKYRHSGYQDSDRKEPSGPRGPRPEHRPPRLEGAPRGRTAGGFGPEVFKCMRCGEQQHFVDGVEVDAVCRKCNSDLHACSNCKNFDTMVRWECRESMNIPERVSPKDVRNQCDLFSPKIIRDLSAGKGRIETPDDARAAFDNLFKK